MENEEKMKARRLRQMGEGILGYKGEQTITREEAYIEMIKGTKITHLSYDDGSYCFADRCEMAHDDGYLIYKKPLTFERIKKECVSMKCFLIDRDGEKRMYIGFSRRGLLITDSSVGDIAVTWKENDIKDWTIKEVEE